MRRIEGVMCDLDGTVCDSEWAHILAWEKIVHHKYGFRLEEGWDLDYIGKPDDYAARAMRNNFPALPETDVLLRERHEAYRGIITEKAELLRYPGLREELEKLSAAGFKLAVGTNSPLENTLTALRSAGIDKYFPVVVAYGMTERGKPAPEIYLEAARRLGVDPAQAVVVEDTPIGIAAGKAAGAIVIAVTTTNPASVLSDADLVIESPAAAMAWIGKNGDPAKRA
ncbi:MAG: HAD family phosphatase [Planctomycetota bacterium]|nr:HAD family phosphatase [Planctomycetota bacterium]